MLLKGIRKHKNNIHNQGKLKASVEDIFFENIVKKKSKCYINFIIIGVELIYR